MRLIPTAILLAAFILTGCGKPSEKAETIENPAATTENPETARPKAPPIVLGDGLTEREFIALAGAPSGQILIGDRKVLSYEGIMVNVIDGMVTELPPDFEASIQAPLEAQAGK